ncbi:MAG TPA: radical SAM protein [Phenylobacterium sp.]
MGPTGDAIKVVQIHPTLRCNLRCQHCYSTSGPELAGGLAIEDLERLLGEIAAEGFNAVSVSGGEPLMYEPLPRLLRSAGALGLITSVTTNGLLLTHRRLAELAPHVGLLAVSVDGEPESHNRLRALPKAFAKMADKLGGVRKAGIPFGVIFTLTRHNLFELAWVADFAIAEGAQLLQVHPLESVGRARDYELTPPDDLELAYAFLEVARLQEKYRGQLSIQFDAADRTQVVREPERAYAVPAQAQAIVEGTPLADLVSPLVVQDDGWIVPIQYGFSRRYAVARMGGDFRAQAAEWRRNSYADFLHLTRGVWDDIGDAPAHLPFTNWYAAVTSASVAFGLRDHEEMGQAPRPGLAPAALD